MPIKPTQLARSPLRDLRSLSHPLFYDNIASQAQGALGNASSGQAWSAGGGTPPQYVEAGAAIEPAITYGAVPSGATEFIASADLGGRVLAGGGKFRIRANGPTTTGGELVIGAWDGTTTNVPVHLVLSQYAFYMSYVSGGVQTLVAPDLRAGSAPYALLNAPLKADSLTIYEVWWVLDYAAGTLYVGLPDGTIASATDTHFQSVAATATKVLFEGTITAATDALFEWVEVWADTKIPTNLRLKLAAANTPPLQTTLPRTQQAAGYTFTLADVGTVVECTDASAANFTIPPSSSVPWVIGHVLELARIGAGVPTIVAGVGVTIQSPGNKVTVGDQYGSVGLRYRGADTWQVIGDLA